MSLSRAEAKKVTFYYERWRALASGILETAGTTFLMLVALRYYNADNASKAAVATGGSVGLILCPLVVYTLGRFHWRATTGAAVICLVGGIGFLAAATFHNLGMFITGSLLGSFAGAAIVPLVTQMYQDNYPEAQRGQLYSRSFMIRIASATAFSQLGGWILSGHMDRFPLILSIYGLALFFSAHCFLRCPSRQLGGLHRASFRSSLRLVQQDVLFRRTLTSWMFMGFGSLMILAIRVEFLGNPAHGLLLSAAAIAIFTGVLPDLVRLAMSPIWGHLFDRVNFYILRIILNLIFASSYLIFFTGTHFWGLVIGAVIFGLASSGGDVAWGLWVTKFSPPDRVAEYMSIHTFMTGLRGMTAPFVAFGLLHFLSVGQIAFIGATLIFISTAMILPEIKLRQTMAEKRVAVEEIGT
jgi:MFS family permease